MANCLVTGANRGIGLQVCRQLAERGDRVIAVCREPSGELEGLNVRIEKGIDVSDPDDVKRLADSLEGFAINWLLNNAGVLRSDGLDAIGKDALEGIYDQFRVNAVGPLLVTRALLDNLAPGARVGIVTSRMGSIADNDSGGYYGYRMSKAAVNAAGKSLAMDLKDREIAVALLHPGFVRTDMTGQQGDVEPAEAAAGLIARMDELTMENTGSFWHAKGQRLPW
ncbi:MAG: SDR family oxidoreductase [Gammaproteobacteria bacterium]